MAAQTRRVDAWVLAAAQSGAVTVREWCLVALAKHPSPSPGALDSFDADMSVMCVAAAGAEQSSSSSTSSSSSSSSSGSGGHGAGGGGRGPDLPALLAELLIQVHIVPPLAAINPLSLIAIVSGPRCVW